MTFRFATAKRLYPIKPPNIIEFPESLMAEPPTEVVRFGPVRTACATFHADDTEAECFPVAEGWRRGLDPRSTEAACIWLRTSCPSAGSP